jgi:hypothetical protein
VRLGTTAAPLKCSLSPLTHRLDMLPCLNLQKVFSNSILSPTPYTFESEYDPVINVEHWTSASGDSSGSNLMWGNGKTLNIQETNWKAGQPNLADGKCVFVQFSNKTANLTTFSMGDCAQKRKFLCEVITFNFQIFNLYRLLCTYQKKMAMSDADIMQRECMYLFGISDGAIFFVSKV